MNKLSHNALHVHLLTVLWYILLLAIKMYEMQLYTCGSSSKPLNWNLSTPYTSHNSHASLSTQQYPYNLFILLQHPCHPFLSPNTHTIPSYTLTPIQYFCPTKENTVSANINIVDTSIKHPISDQSTTVVKCCMYIMFNVVDTAFS